MIAQQVTNGTPLVAVNEMPMKSAMTSAIELAIFESRVTAPGLQQYTAALRGIRKTEMSVSKPCFLLLVLIRHFFELEYPYRPLTLNQIAHGCRIDKY